MQINRIYTNSSGDTLRVDELNRQIIPNFEPIVTYDNDGPIVRFGPQRIKTTLLNTTGVSRTVAGIQIVGEYTDLETSSGDYQWAKKTLGNDRDLVIEMSNLPGIGDTV